MKYDYVTYRLGGPAGMKKWIPDLRNGIIVMNMSKKRAMDKFIDRHTKLVNLAWSGNHDIKFVTLIRKGGDMKGTDSFEYFFDYTRTIGKERVRYREAIRFNA